MFFFEALYFLYKKKNSERIVVGETREREREGERERWILCLQTSINTYETEIMPFFLDFHMPLSQKRTQRGKQYVRTFQESLSTFLSRNISRSLTQPVKGKAKMLCLNFLFVHQVSLPDLHFFNISCFSSAIKTYTRKSIYLRGGSKKKLVKNDKCQADASLCQISFST